MSNFLGIHLNHLWYQSWYMEHLLGYPYALGTFTGLSLCLSELKFQIHTEPLFIHQ